MKLQFKVQQFQSDAVDAVADVFAGQPLNKGLTYAIDPGKLAATQATLDVAADPKAGLRNAEIALTPSQVLDGIKTVQKAQNLTPSTVLVQSKAGKTPNTPNLDIEMETGTGKTYVYIKTMMELNKRYGWSKFIVVVPSVAIREGVKKTFDITGDHFQEAYGTKPRSFIYDSRQLHELEGFSSDAGVQVMIINIQAFNSRGQDNRRIYDVLDDFQSRRPIDVIKANRPILIIDEPQKIGATTSLESLSNFNPLMILRYSATHKVEYNKVHRLDALDAYNQKLVKKIAVRGITVKGLAGSTAYLYLDGIEIKAGAKPQARIELQVQTKGSGIKQLPKKVSHGTNLHDLSGGIEAYKPDGKPLIVTDIDAVRDIIELSNGDVISVGQVTKDLTEESKRRIQIREVIRAHIDKERSLFSQGIKALSLFFIDEVAKYRDYSREDTLGEYARIFEEEYVGLVADEAERLQLNGDDTAYATFLASIPVRKTHQGYFSIDKKTKHDIDGDIKKSGEEKGLSTDVSAYDLILKDKERLLSFEEPVRFLFSHSALREGWDNPNVFVMGMLKKSDNTVSRRQEIGRGLRLSVNQDGVRQDSPDTVHEINQLTVVTDESYTDFVTGLQKEIKESLSSRPQKASVKHFTGKTYEGPDGTKSVVEESMANSLLFFLIQSQYLNQDYTVSDAYKEAKEAGALAVPMDPDLKSVIDYLWPLVDDLYLNIGGMVVPAPSLKAIPFNKENFDKKEFQELWGRINHKAVYQVDFDSEELIAKCVAALDSHLKVTQMQYVVQSGVQKKALDVDDLAKGTGFTVTSTSTQLETKTASSQVKYDLIGEITEKTQLTRRTASQILQKIRKDTFAKFKQNPEHFITECARLINEQKATVIVEHLTYDTLEDTYGTAIFTENQTKQDFAKAGDKLKRHVYDYVVTDSKIERDFVTELDTSQEVVVYAKLPRGFFIPTPVGTYNPDWAIAFKEGSVKHVYFVAETKGSLSSLQLKGIEEAKIQCARKFFASLSEGSAENVKYDVITNYSDLMQVVSS